MLPPNHILVLCPLLESFSPSLTRNWKGKHNSAL